VSACSCHVLQPSNTARRIHTETFRNVDQRGANKNRKARQTSLRVIYPVLFGFEICAQPLGRRAGRSVRLELMAMKCCTKGHQVTRRSSCQQQLGGRGMGETERDPYEREGGTVRRSRLAPFLTVRPQLLRSHKQCISQSHSRRISRIESSRR
jgi:hypothetical protein